MKKVAVIGTVGIPAKYGGFETLVEQLSLHIDDLTVYCSGPAYPKKAKTHNRSQLKYIPLKANGWQSVLYDSWSILNALRHSDTLLILGVAGAFTLPFIKPFLRKKICVHIDGLEWRRPKWGYLTRRFLRFSEALAARYSDVIIADNEALVDYIQERYGRRSDLVAYGGDHVRLEQDNGDSTSGSYAVSVCRIEPENNIHIILEGFAKATHRRLKLIGNWRSSRYGSDLLAKYSGFKNIEMLDPIYDQAQLDRLRGNAEVYIHGHSAGGTNPSLVEAMSLGLPVFAYDVSFNRYTTENLAGYFEDSAELATLLERSDPEYLRRMGRDLRGVAQQRYTWKRIAAQYSDILFGPDVVG